MMHFVFLNLTHLIFVCEVSLGSLSPQHIPLQLIQKHLQLSQHLSLLSLSVRGHLA